MLPYLSVIVLLLLGFILYHQFVRDNLFVSDVHPAESFEVPAPASIQIRQAPLYPERTVAPSGPNPPNQLASDEVIVYGPPGATDPYQETHESSDIPENLRNPEQSFRPPPLNHNTTIPIQSGVASMNRHVSQDNSQGFKQELIQGGGEFMPGIFANDTFNDASFSAF
jgi:hypothetical protein